MCLSKSLFTSGFKKARHSQTGGKLNFLFSWHRWRRDQIYQNQRIALLSHHNTRLWLLNPVFSTMVFSPDCLDPWLLGWQSCPSKLHGTVRLWTHKVWWHNRSLVLSFTATPLIQFCILTELKTGNPWKMPGIWGERFRTVYQQATSMCFCGLRKPYFIHIVSPISTQGHRVFSSREKDPQSFDYAFFISVLRLLGRDSVLCHAKLSASK